MDKWDGCFICSECEHRWSEHHYQDGNYICPVWTQKALDEAKERADKLIEFFNKEKY